MLDKNDPIKTFEPIWEGWKIESFIGEGSYGRVYKAVRKSGGRTYTGAIKHIRVPKTQAEMAQARQLGMDGVSLYSYFEDMSAIILKEVDIMFKLKGIPNIVSYRDYSVIHEEGKPRWDIFIRMEHLETLTAYMERTPMSEDEIVRLGMEMCTALSACHAKSIIHRDIKESNIFVDRKGTFKLGDFGIAREASERSRSMSMRGTPAYIAPEIARGKRYGLTVDIYSLGILLYKLLNHGRYPFMPPAPQQIRFEDTDKSLERRLSGEPLPPPARGSQALQAAVLKACSYRSSDRFQSPDEFRDALSGKVRVVSPRREAIAWETEEAEQDTPQKPTVIGGKTGSRGDGTTVLIDASGRRSTAREEEERRAKQNAEATMRRRAAERKERERQRKLAEKRVKRIVTIVSVAAALVAITAGILVYTTVNKRKAVAQEAQTDTTNVLIVAQADPPLPDVTATIEPPPATASTADATVNDEAPTAAPAPTTPPKRETPTPTPTEAPKRAARMPKPTPTPTQYTSQWSDWSDWSDLPPASASNRETESRYCFRTRETMTSGSANENVNGWNLYHYEATSDGYTAWSDWSTTAYAASDTTQVEQKTQYSFRDKQITTSSESSIPGWTLIDTSISYSAWSGWSSWGTTSSQSSDVVDVETRTNATTKTQYGYFYYHGKGSKGTWKHFCPDCLRRDGYTTITGPTWVWLDSQLSSNNSWSGCGHGSGRHYGFKASSGAVYSTSSSGSTRTAETGSTTEYRTRTRNVIYTYTFSKYSDWSAWSDQMYSASSEREVREQTLFRYRGIVQSGVYYYERWSNWSPWQSAFIAAQPNTEVRVQFRYRDRWS